MTKKIVVLAAGMSSRMKKSVDSNIDSSKVNEANNKSKSLITFGNKPFIYFLLKNILDAGFETVIMVVGKDFQDFKNQIDELKLPLKIEVLSRAHKSATSSTTQIIDCSRSLSEQIEQI